MSSLKKYALLALLYFTQTVPFSFFGTAIPVILRQKGFSLENIGYFQLIALPFSLKVLWAPLIDKYSHTRRGYRGWIQIATLLYACFTLIAAFFSFENLLFIILLLFFAIMCLSTQDIAVDAMAVTILKDDEERSIGNGIQSGGNYFGFLFGGGILLMTYPYLGWKLTIVLLTGIALLPLFKLKGFIPEKKHQHKEKISLKDLITYFKVPEFKAWIPVLLLLTLPNMVIFHTLKPLLYDKGLSLSQVALVYGIFAMLAALSFGLLSGYLLRKMNRRNKLLLTAFANLLMVGAAVMMTYLSYSGFYAITMLCFFIGAVSGLNYMAFAAVAMEFTRPGKEGTDYAFQTFLRGFLVFPLMPLTGFVADHWGYALMFVSMGILTFITGLYIVFKFH